ncbi:hypothetical protein KBB73_01445 [Candidatus Saccharibacteria bacterium]|jgi:hypothetical protein|nr:hypothetical protein [Candidatus Saccharibacteria bacterium]
MSENKPTEKVIAIRKGDNNEVVLPKKAVVKKQFSPLVVMIRRVAIWVTIISAGILAFISIIAIWADISDIIGRTWSTFIVILFASGFIAMVAPLLDQYEK